MINYRKASDAGREAWMAYKESRNREIPRPEISVIIFMAGYNSAVEEFRKNNLSEDEIVRILQRSEGKEL